MNSKIGKLAIAAAIVIAVLIGLQVWSPFGSNVTFARAIQPILNANTAILNILIGEETDDTPVIHDMVMGSRIRRTISNIPNNVSIIDLESGRILSLSQNEKEATYIDLKGLPSIPNYLDHLKNVMLKLQDSAEFTVEDLGIRQMDGHEAVGFLAKHPKLEISLWADARTGLPIRIDHKEGQLRVICRDVQFDVHMDEALFSMEVPEGYKLKKMELDLFGATEEDFIEGLRILAETFGDGQFPDSVALEDYLRRAPALAARFEQLGLSEEEQLAMGGTLQKYILFLRFFQGQGQWYYRGKGVRLGAAETPIFWYRPKNSETYRVIYGDLHVEDATPDALPEPLAPDDVPAGPIGFHQWSRPDFVGRQEDYWYVQPDGRAQVEAHLTLLKGPQGVSLLPIRLPYDSSLEAVMYDDRPLTFRETGPGAYVVEMPLDELEGGEANLLCRWHVSLADLRKGPDDYRTVLQSLVPVISYKLGIGVDPPSGFDLARETPDAWFTLFTRNGMKPGTEFGSCGLAIRQKQ